MEQFDKNTMEMLHQFIETCVYKTVEEKLQNGWGTWRESVVANFKDVERKDDEIIKSQTEIKISLEVLKTEMKIKSGLWGATAGVVTVAFAIAMYLLKGLLK